MNTIKPEVTTAAINPVLGTIIEWQDKIFQVTSIIPSNNFEKGFNFLALLLM